MRLWLAEDERRPDPEPARADGRKAVLAGTVAWTIALVCCLIWPDELGRVGLEWLLPASVIGVIIGAVGLVVVQVLRARNARQSSR